MKEVIARINGFQREGHRPVIEIERELIRCKECKHWDKSRINYNEHVCYWGGYVKREDDFCSWAERKDNGETD